MLPSSPTPSLAESHWVFTPACARHGRRSQGPGRAARRHPGRQGGQRSARVPGKQRAPGRSQGYPHLRPRRRRSPADLGFPVPPPGPRPFRKAVRQLPAERRGPPGGFQVRGRPPPGPAALARGAGAAGTPKETHSAAPESPPSALPPDRHPFRLRIVVALRRPAVETPLDRRPHLPRPQSPGSPRDKTPPPPPEHPTSYFPTPGRVYITA